MPIRLESWLQPTIFASLCGLVISIGASDPSVANAQESSPPQKAEETKPSAAEAKPPKSAKDWENGRPAPLTVGSRENFEPVPPSHLLDVGAGLVMVSMFHGNGDGTARTIRFDPGPGINFWARITICPYMQVAAVFSWDSHHLDIDHGALGLDGAAFESGRLTSYRLEAHTMPTLPLGDTVRLYGILGLGWGRLEVGPMHATDRTGRYVIRGRGASYFDVPMGFGTAIEVVPGWISVDIGIWTAATFQKDGTAFTDVQALDGAGVPRNVAALPEVPFFFVSSLGASLVL